MKKHEQLRSFIKEKRFQYEELLRKRQQDKDNEGKVGYTTNFDDLSSEQRDAVMDVLQDAIADLYDLETTQ